MLMINEYGSAVKRAHSEEEIQDLLASGWKPYEEKQPVCKAVKADPVEPMSAPRVVERTENPLMYNDQYLSQLVNTASHAELRKIFTAKGIEFASRTSKSDMQKRLRQYIRETKTMLKEEKNL